MVLNHKPLRFAIRLVQYAFYDAPDKHKIRPAMIVDWDRARDYGWVTKITTHVPRANDAGDIVLDDWKEAGLLLPSTVRCSQVLRVPSSLILRDQPFGVLTLHDASRVMQLLTQLHEDLFD